MFKIACSNRSMGSKEKWFSLWTYLMAFLNAMWFPTRFCLSLVRGYLTRCSNRAYLFISSNVYLKSRCVKKKRKKTRLDCGEIYSSSCNAKDYINYVLRTTRWLKYIDNLYNLVHVVAIPKESFMFLAVLVYFSPMFCFMLSKCYEILKKIFHQPFGNFISYLRMAKCYRLFHYNIFLYKILCTKSVQLVQERSVYVFLGT